MGETIKGEFSANTVTKELDRIDTTRLGWIKKLDAETNTIWVDYERNQAQVPLPAKLANPWISWKDLMEAISKEATARIDFEDGNPLKPIIRDIFYSISAIKETHQQSTKKRVIHIEAEEIILKGNKRVVIQSGKAKTTYIAEGGELIEEAEQIDSSASKNQRIKGGKVFLN